MTWRGGWSGGWSGGWATGWAGPSAPAPAARASSGPAPSVSAPASGAAVVTTTTAMDIILLMYVEPGDGSDTNDGGTLRPTWTTDLPGYTAAVTDFLAWEVTVYNLGYKIDFSAGTQFWTAALANAGTYGLHGGVNLAAYLKSRGHAVYTHVRGSTTTAAQYADAAQALFACLPTADLIVGSCDNSFLATAAADCTSTDTLYIWAPTQAIDVSETPGGVTDAEDRICGVWTRDGMTIVGRATGSIAKCSGLLGLISDGNCVDLITGVEVDWTTCAVRLDFHGLTAYANADDTAAEIVATIQAGIASAGTGCRVVTSPTAAAYKLSRFGAADHRNTLVSGPHVD